LLTKFEDPRAMEAIELYIKQTARRCVEIAEDIGRAEFPKNAGYCAGAAIAAAIRGEFGVEEKSR
jgi:hypothetical protein